MPSLSPPSPSTPLSPLNSEKIAFKDSPWRPILACVGSLAAILLLAPLLIKPPSPRGAGNNAPILLLPRASTMVMRLATPPGATLRGQLRLVADVMGQAPVAGEVARQLVEPGARVKRGDPVLEISSGASQRVAPIAESQQNLAEKSQIAATDAQTDLAQRVSIAQGRLRATQERIQSAQEQVATARDLVRRLQNGEKVSSREIPSPFRAPGQGHNDTAIAPPRRSAPKTDNRAAEIALQQAGAAKDAAREGTRDLQTARQMLFDAQKGVRDAADASKAATQAVADVEARFDDKKASAADVEAAREAQKEAQISLGAAQRAQNSARTEQAKREKNAANLQKYADKAASDAQKAMGGAELFDAAPTPAANVAAQSGNSAGLTLDQAIRFASAALEESRHASRDAEKIQAEIAEYQKQAQNSHTRIEETTQNLATAQQKVLDSVPRPRFTSALSPADGIVTWVSRLAREVEAGQSVFGLARGQKVGARFEDKTGLWRGLKPGALVSALVAPPAPKVGSGAVLPAENRAIIEVRVTSIEAPQNADDAAIVTGEVRAAGEDEAQNSTNAPALREGTTVLASVARPGEKPSLSVPPSALVQSGDTTFVAVLTPIPAPQMPISAPQSAKAASSDSNEAPTFHLRWQKVEIGRGDAIRREIVRGLVEGSRVVVLPSLLQEMGFFPAVSSRDGATIAAETASQSPEEELLVRLTLS